MKGVVDMAIYYGNGGVLRTAEKVAEGGRTHADLALYAKHIREYFKYGIPVFTSPEPHRPQILSRYQNPCRIDFSLGKYAPVGSVLYNLYVLSGGTPANVQKGTDKSAYLFEQTRQKALEGLQTYLDVAANPFTIQRFLAYDIPIYESPEPEKVACTGSQIPCRIDWSMGKFASSKSILALLYDYYVEAKEEREAAEAIQEEDETGAVAPPYTM